MSSSHPIRRSMPKPNFVVTKLRPFSTCFVPPSFLLASRPGRPRRSREELNVRSLHQTEQLRSIFVDALVRAGGSSHGHIRARKPPAPPRRRSSTSVQKALPDERPRTEHGSRFRRPRTREELLNLLDFYEDWSSASRSETDAQRSNQDDEEDELLGWSEKGFGCPLGDYDGELLGRTLDDLDRLLMDDKSMPEAIFSTYKELPSPGVQFLSKEQRIYLIRRLSITDNKTASRTIAYLSLLDDYRAVRLPIPRHAWNSAISLGSTTLRKISEVEVEFAVSTWKQMELEADVKADVATFNILFIVASKAGKFDLARMILQEMEARGIEFERYSRFAIIMYHGLRRDGDGVRKAYRDLVEAKEVVDTAVLNCVMSALLSAGEHDSAFNLFSRMKHMAEEDKVDEPAPLSFWEKRDQFIEHNRTGKARRGEMIVYSGVRENHDKITRVQEESGAHQTAGRQPDSDDPRDPLEDAVSLAPDAVTFATLLRHYCNSGEFMRAVVVLEDMQSSSIMHTEDTFAHLFRAFATFGIVRYTAWTPDRLQSVWIACRSSFEAGEITLNERHKLMGIWALVATRRLCSFEAAAQVYSTLKEHWRGEADFEQDFTDPMGQDSAAAMDLVLADEHAAGGEDIPREEHAQEQGRGATEAESEDWDALDDESR